MGGKESQLQCVLRRVAVLLILPGGPLFMLLHLYAPPQHVGIGHQYQTRAIGRFWPYRTEAIQDPANKVPRIYQLVEKSSLDGWALEWGGRHR
jgi:hypothetical protein